MSLQKANIGGFIYDVVTAEEFYNNPSMYDQYKQYIAITPGDGFVYPIRNVDCNLPGLYPIGGFDLFRKPSDNEAETYSTKNIIDFSRAEDYKDFMMAQQKLTNAERSILTTIDNVFTPNIEDNDTPEMKAMKQAVLDKHIDLDKYEQRFGPNYNNDKRLFKKPSITFSKLRSICEALDIKASITLEDADSDVPNPIGRVITVDITSPNTTFEEDE